MKHFVGVVLFILFSTCQAELKAEHELMLLAGKVMSQVEKGDFDKAVDLLRPHWPLPEHEIDSLIYEIKRQQPIIDERFGSQISSQPVCVQAIGDSWRRINYLQKYDKHSLLWMFDFYKPGDSWLLNTFVFKDRWQALYENGCSRNKILKKG